MPEQLRGELRHARTLKKRSAQCLQRRPDTSWLLEPLQAAKLALRSLARRIRDLDRELNELDRELEQLVATAAPRTVALFGVGTRGAGQLLVTAGQNIDRFKSEGAFAKVCAAAPIPASSGCSSRHRLDYGGDRPANRALYFAPSLRRRPRQLHRRTGMRQRSLA